MPPRPRGEGRGARWHRATLDIFVFYDTRSDLIQYNSIKKDQFDTVLITRKTKHNTSGLIAAPRTTGSWAYL